MDVNLLTDFPDRLSPMLVKELRQGMRARGFTMVFLGLQGLLAFILLTTGAALESDGAGSAASGTIFTLFAIAVLGIQPMRGSNALSSEITSNTIEMMVLTRLSAWRIVFGKWIAIVSQSALLLATIIPYLILRYFFGGMNLLGEMVLLALIFLTSMALTALMVGFSATTSKLARILPIFGIIILANIGSAFFSRGRFGGGSAFFTLSDWHSIVAIGCYVTFISYAGWCALSHGTSVIAPAAENHTTIRRLVALVLTIAAAVTAYFAEFEAEATLLLIGGFAVPALITSLTEPVVILPPVCYPFLKRGLLGKIAAAFLLPGWPTGVFYSGLLIVIGIAGVTLPLFTKSLGSIADDVALGGLCCVGSILFPATLAALFSKQEDKRFTNFMLFLVGSVILTVATMVISGMSNERDLLWAMVWNPSSILFMRAVGHFRVEDLTLAVSLVSSLYMGLLFVTAIIRYRDYRRVFNETQEGMLDKVIAVPHNEPDA